MVGGKIPPRNLREGVGFSKIGNPSRLYDTKISNQRKYIDIEIPTERACLRPFRS